MNGSLSVLQSDIGFSIPGSQFKTDKDLPSSMRPLNFYEFEKDGKTLTAMEIYLPHYLRAEYGENVNIADFTEEALQVIGFGTPTEGLNSMDFIKVAGFLPRNMGATVIVPHEFIAKTGKDFDIDKYTLYLPHVQRKPDGKIGISERVTSPEELFFRDPRI
jgi:hypothetical protein